MAKSLCFSRILANKLTDVSCMNYQTEQYIVVSAVQDKYHLPASLFQLSTFPALVLSCKRHWLLFKRTNSIPRSVCNDGM